jgi:membrane protein DedA with SNARE-associated domain
MDYTTIVHLIATYGPFILLPIMIVEGPIITIIAAFLASLGVLNIFFVYTLAYIGNVIGDVAYYNIGRFGRETFIKHYGKYIGLHEENILHIENHYKKQYLRTILIAKITEAPIVPTLIAAGIAKTDFRKFLPLIAVIEIFKVLIFVVVGFYFGEFYKVIGAYLKDESIAAGMIAIIMVVFIVLYRKLKLKKL